MRAYPAICLLLFACLLALLPGQAGARTFIVTDPFSDQMNMTTFDYYHMQEYDPSLWQMLPWHTVLGVTDSTVISNTPVISRDADLWGTAMQYRPDSLDANGQPYHVVAWLRQATGGYINGTVYMSDGSTHTFYVNYHPGLLDGRLTWGLAGDEGLAEAGTGAGAGLLIDLARDDNTGQIYLTMYQDNTIGPVFYPQTLQPIGADVTISGYEISGTSMTNATFYDWPTANVQAAQNLQNLANYHKGTDVEQAKGRLQDLLDFVDSVISALATLAAMLLYLLGFLIWLAEPHHIGLVLICAEGLIWIFALEQRRRGIFHVMATWALLHYQIYTGGLALLQTGITAVSQISLFIYNTVRTWLPSWL